MGSCFCDVEWDLLPFLVRTSEEPAVATAFLTTLIDSSVPGLLLR